MAGNNDHNSRASEGTPAAQSPAPSMPRAVARLTVWRGAIAVGRRTRQMAYLSRLTEESQQRLLRTLWKNDRLGQILVVVIGSVSLVATLAASGWASGVVCRQYVAMPTSGMGEAAIVVVAVLAQISLTVALTSYVVRSVASSRIRRLVRALGNRDVCCHCLHELSNAQEVCPECGRPVDDTRRGGDKK